MKSKETFRGSHYTPLGVWFAYSLKTGQSERLPVKKIIKKNFITKDLLKTLGDPEEELELISLTKLLLTPGVSSEVRREPPGIPS